MTCACGTEFQVHPSVAKLGRRYCSRECKGIAQRRDPYLRKRRAQANRYGITVEALDALVLAQTGRCACCGEPGELVLDHDHGTGGVRELICRRCNLALAALEGPVLNDLIGYLARHGKAVDIR